MKEEEKRKEEEQKQQREQITTNKSITKELRELNININSVHLDTQTLKTQILHLQDNVTQIRNPPYPQMIPFPPYQPPHSHQLPYPSPQQIQNNLDKQNRRLLGIPQQPPQNIQQQYPQQPLTELVIRNIPYSPAWAPDGKISTQVLPKFSVICPIDHQEN